MSSGFTPQSEYDSCSGSTIQPPPNKGISKHQFSFQAHWCRVPLGRSTCYYPFLHGDTAPQLHHARSTCALAGRIVSLGFAEMTELMVKKSIKNMHMLAVDMIMRMHDAQCMMMHDSWYTSTCSNMVAYMCFITIEPPFGIVLCLLVLAIVIKSVYFSCLSFVVITSGSLTIAVSRDLAIETDGKLGLRNYCPGHVLVTWKVATILLVSWNRGTGETNMAIQ